MATYVATRTGYFNEKIVNVGDHVVVDKRFTKKCSWLELVKDPVKSAKIADKADSQAEIVTSPEYGEGVGVS